MYVPPRIAIQHPPNSWIIGPVAIVHQVGRRVQFAAGVGVALGERYLGGGRMRSAKGEKVVFTSSKSRIIQELQGPRRWVGSRSSWGRTRGMTERVGPGRGSRRTRGARKPRSVVRVGHARPRHLQEHTIRARTRPAEVAARRSHPLTTDAPTLESPASVPTRARDPQASVVIIGRTRGGVGSWIVVRWRILRSVPPMSLRNIPDWGAFVDAG